MYARQVLCKELRMSTNAANQPGQVSENAAVLATYAEVCRSYHAIDEFRMKLLGLLPLASLIAVFMVDQKTLVVGQVSGSASGHELLAFAAIFAAMLTLALFGYEIRGIQRCHNLINEGKHIEELLGVGHGQFHVCADEHEHPAGIARALNAKLIACIIYSLVFAGWLFLALRVGFRVEAFTCAVSAVIVGTAVALTMYVGVRRLTSS